MGRFNSSFTLISFHFPLFIIFSFLPTSTSDSPPGSCGTPAANCWLGTCRNTFIPPFNFDCDCYPGWSKPSPLPYCVIPNCTLNLQCGNGAPPPPPLPPLPPPPPFSLFQNFSACSLFPPPTLCGDGSCVPDGINYKCECPDDMVNLLGLPALPCIKKCSLGADCNALLPLSSPSPPPPATSSAPPKMGPVDSPNSANYQTLSTILLLTGSLLLWI